eukprot:Phypoly_transcript_19093.p1 GENE.Phypoly_transcript_19093~~Phypoly_transcript_19093.p1  ORF type:complete len:146 (+),score=17.58 Phypoly_transcript_19093:202-639(+)
MSQQENQYRHLLHTYYGNVIERANFDNILDFCDENYIAHFPGKDLDINGLKDFVKSLHSNLRNIYVELGNDRLVNDILHHEFLFQGNMKDDNSPVEWRSENSWRVENGKFMESWHETTITYDQMMDLKSLKKKAPAKNSQGQAQI